MRKKFGCITWDSDELTYGVWREWTSLVNYTLDINMCAHDTISLNFMVLYDNIKTCEFIENIVNFLVKIL